MLNTFSLIQIFKKKITWKLGYQVILHLIQYQYRAVIKDPIFIYYHSVIPD